jgi:RNA polymerase sigma-70 factor (ECF subfamily)
VVRSVIAAVLGVGKNHPDVEDCTHEALSRALEGRGRLREGEPLRPWVLGIARHVALDALRDRRKARREQPAEGAQEGEGAQASWLERLADPAPGPEERAASAERGRRLQRAMLMLSNEQRTALVMFHVDGLGYQEIASRLGVPLGTVATWISRGRRSIAEAFGE